MAKTNYISNKNLLREINNSKMTYCQVLDKKYHVFDYITEDLTNITDELFQEIKTKRKSRLEGIEIDKLNKKSKTYQQERASINIDVNDEDVVIRLMTKEHIIPYITGKIKINFPPFKHFIKQDNQWVEVVRSHWEGDFTTGKLNLNKGKLSNELVLMFMALAKRYSFVGKFRDYTYREDMVSEATLHLCINCLKFNESRSDNPFSFYTTLVTNCFKATLKIEAKYRDLKDDIAMENNMPASFNSQDYLIEEASKAYYSNDQSYGHSVFVDAEKGIVTNDL